MPTAEGVLNPFIGYEPARYTRSRLFDSVPTVSLALSILLLRFPADYGTFALQW